MNKTDIILLFHLDKVSKSWLFTSGVIDLLSKSIPCKNVPFRMVYSGWSLEFQNKDRTKNSVPLPVEIPSKNSNNQFWMGTKNLWISTKRLYHDNLHSRNYQEMNLNKGKSTVLFSSRMNWYEGSVSHLTVFLFWVSNRMA